jgi:hypothetical protein
MNKDLRRALIVMGLFGVAFILDALWPVCTIPTTKAIAPAVIAAIISAIGALGSSYMASKKKIPGPTGQGQMGGFKPSAENFMKKTGGDSDSAAQLAAILGGSGSPEPEVLAALPAPQPITSEMVALPDRLPEGQRITPEMVAMYGDLASKGGEKTLDPAMYEGLTSNFGEKPMGDFKLAALLPYISAASQVGGAISEGNRPTPVALQKGHMGGYNPTVPDAQELLRMMLAKLFRRQ